MKNHINWFFSLNAAHDLLPFFTGCKKAAGKEVTESIACFKAATDNLGEKLENYVVIVVGDGVKPRTGSVFAFLSKAEVHSIDPNMKLEWFHMELPEKFNVKPQRLFVYKDKAENIKIDCKGRPCLIVAPHSHCSMDEMLTVPTNYCNLALINMPCCVDVHEKYTNKTFAQKHELKYYSDPDCWSPKRKIFVWKNLR